MLFHLSPRWLTCLAVVAVVARSGSAADLQPIAIAEVKRDGAVDFRKDILPILQKKCLACHNTTDAESELVLENPQSILKGGAEGPAVVAGKGSESHLLKLAAGQQEPVMPPDGNKVGAKKLTPDELGLIKLWIDQGATGTGPAGPEPIKWQSLPVGVNPIYAVAISADGQWAAASRANQIFLYHVPTKREYGRLTDPALISAGIYQQPGVAHLDLVQSMKFSPDSQLLVSGEYRTVKFWQRSRNHRQLAVTGFESPIKSLAVNSTGQMAAFGEENGKIRLYDLASGSPVRSLEGQHAAAVTGLMFAVDDSRLLSGSQDKKLGVWTVADGKLVGMIETPAPVNAVAFLAPDQRLVSGGADHVLRVWDPASIVAAEPAKPSKELTGHSGPVTSLANHPANPQQLISGSVDGTIRIWDVEAGKQLQQWAHGGPVNGIAVRPDGAVIASASANHTIKLWNAKDGKSLAELKGDHRSRIRAEEAQLLSAVAKRHVDGANADLKQATDRKQAEEKNAKSAEEAHTKAMEELTKKSDAAKKATEEKTAADKAFEDSKVAATKAELLKTAAEAAVVQATEGIVKAKADLEAVAKALTDATEAAKKATETQAKATEELAKDAENEGLKKAVAESEQAVQAAETSVKKVTEDKAGKEKAVAAAEAVKKGADEAQQKTAAELAAAQNAVKEAEKKAAALKEPTQKTIDERDSADKATQSASRSFDRAKESVQKAAAAVPDCESAVKQMEEKLKAAQAAVEQANQAVTATEKPVTSVAFSRNGQTLATAGEDQIVHLWDAQSGVAVDSLAGHEAAGSLLGYSADHRLVSVAANNTVMIWDTQPEWQLVRTVGSPDNGDLFVDRVTALDFSPDGKLLATGGGDPSRSGQLKILNVEDGSVVKEIADAHSDVIYGVAYSPDGKSIASCGADRFAKIFDLTSGQLVKSFEGHTHHVLGVTWRADGRLLATSGADMVVKVWDVRSGDQQRTIQGFNKEVTAVRFMADSDNIVASCGDNSVQMKNAANGGNVRGFGGSIDFVHCCSVSGNGKLVIAGGQDSIVRMWNENGQEYAVFAAPATTARAEPAAAAK